MPNTVAATFFRIAQIILLPIAGVAYLILLVKLILYNRRSGGIGYGACVFLYSVDAARTGHEAR